jgi:tRNA pseudouridine13 synthase
MEETIGISVFLTNTPGIGGRLRKDPEDFVVEEISSELEPTEGGKYSVARIRSRNWETNRLVRHFARKLRMSRKKIRFAGTKDKRAVTTQLFQFDCPPEMIDSLSIADVEILKVFETDERLDIGRLFGNKFKIVLHEIKTPIEEAQAVSFETGRDILETGGFPNFFGVQRFGAIRPITHLVGRHIIKGDFEQAVMNYVANPIEGEPEEAYDARRNLQKDGDYSKALQDYPDRLSFEKAVLNHLVKEPEDFIGALEQLPENLLLMFVHAHQSFMFNKILSLRMDEGLPLNEPITGDCVLPLDRYGLPDHDNWITVKERNVEKIGQQVKRKKAFVSSVLFGRKSVFCQGEMGEIERKVIEDEGLTNDDFFVSEMRRLSSNGTRRELLAPLDEIEIENVDNSLSFTFQLNKGCYATSLLREFMKTDAMSY